MAIIIMVIVIAVIVVQIFSLTYIIDKIIIADNDITAVESLTIIIVFDPARIISKVRLRPLRIIKCIIWAITVFTIIRCQSFSKSLIDQF